MTLNNLLQKIILKPTIHTEGYGFIDIIGGKLRISHTKNGKSYTYYVDVDQKNLEEKVKQELNKIFLHQKHKLIATKFNQQEIHKKIASRLWLDEDIVSFSAKNEETNETINIEEIIKSVSSNFDQDNIAHVRVKDDNEVEVTDLVTLEDYQKTCSETDWETLLDLTKKFQGKRLAFINATPQGGGVALMRHALIRLFRLLKADVHWYILKPNQEVFNITKRKFHNILQAVASPDTMLTQEDKKLYSDWILENAKIFTDRFKELDAVVIDDPQPCGLIPHIKKLNPKIKIIYRSHIQIEAALVNKKGTPQYKTWQFLWDSIKDADLFVSHPVPQFIPEVVPPKKVVYMPAVTDPLDGLNKPLTNHQMDYYLHLFNKFAKIEGQSPLDLKRPFIIQLARFDPSKGIPDVLKSYLKMTQLLKESGQKAPQLVITGNGSVDDPDRAPIFSMVMDIISSKEYEQVRKDIKVVRLPHIDQLLNTLLRKSAVVLQLSTKEGFEIKVTEALMKGKPVIAYKTGGIPLQIKDTINGFLVEPGNTDQVAKHLFNLITNQQLYSHMSWAAENYYDKSLLTIQNASRWLNISLNLLD